MVLGFNLFFALFNNLAIFIALVTVYGYLISQSKTSTRLTRQLLFGTCFGLFAIGCMYAKIPVAEGVIVDQRNAIVALGGAFGGPLSAVVSAFFASGYRAYLGGTGVLSGVVGVWLAAISGIILNRVSGCFSTVPKAMASALFATLVIFPGWLFYKDIQTGWALLKAMALPFGLAIFSGIFMVGRLLNREAERYFFELSFRESEKRYRELVEGTDDLILYTDNRGRITFANLATTRILDVTPEQCVGMSVFQFIHPEDKSALIQLLADGIAEKRNQLKIENRLINLKANESRAIMWLFSIHRDASGRLIGVGGIGRDCTERKRVEGELENYRRHLEALVKDRTAALEVKNKELELFTYSVAHDLKAPLRSIDGYSRLLDEDYAGVLDAEGLQFLGNIRHSTERMHQLIEDLLTYARMERRDLNLSIVNIRQLIDELLFEWKHEIHAKSVRLTIDISHDQVVGDRDSLRQILGNFIDNALKFTTGETTPEIDISVSKISDRLHFSVKDNGIGFDPKYHDRIFAIFQRLHRAEDFPGTGVGLALVRKAASRMNGKTWADSRPGEGAIFHLELPEMQMKEA